MEPLIQAGNEGVVHHFVLNTCIYRDPLPDGFEGDEFLCSQNGGMDEEDLPYHPKCEQLVGIWAVGGEVCSNCFYVNLHNIKKSVPEVMNTCFNFCCVSLSYVGIIFLNIFFRLTIFLRTLVTKLATLTRKCFINLKSTMTILTIVLVRLI